MKIKVLEQSQIEQIRQKSEVIIEKTGFRVDCEELLKIASNAGAAVDFNKKTVRIPAQLLHELLSKVPGSYVAKCVDGKEYNIGSGRQHISAIVTDPWIIDYKSKVPRRPSLDDVRTNTILSQRNDKVFSIGRMDFPVTDYTDNTSSLRALEEHLLNHTKHYNVYTATMSDFKKWLKLGEILTRGGDLAASKLMTVAVAVVSPLVLPEFNAKVLIEAARLNFTIIPTICPMAGTTSPYSKDSTLMLGNAENIFIAALTQMVNPGNPFLYAFGPSVTDMRTGHDLYYTMDKVLWKIAATELANSYNMPVSAECGGTLSYRYDMQSGAESMLFMLSAVNSGADIIAGLGSCFNANGLSSEMIVIQSAWLEAASFLSRGINMDYLSKSIQSITEQGPGGNYLIDDLTIELLRSNEFFSNDLFDLTGIYPGEKSMLEKANSRVESLKTGFESPVPGDIQEGIRRYFEKLYKEV